MTTEQDEHVAPVEAWDVIASDYDRHVAPGEAGFATEALKLAGLQPAAAGVRKHVQRVQFLGSGRRHFRRFERFVLFPVGLPLGFDR